MSKSEEAREKLAELEHEQWAHWTQYFLANLTVDNLKRWKRQMMVPYTELSEPEKDKDRVWADKNIKAFKDAGGVFLKDNQSLPKNKADAPIRPWSTEANAVQAICAVSNSYSQAQEDMWDANFRRVEI